MDALSEILRGVVLKGALYFNAEFSAPWGFRHTGDGGVGPAAHTGRASSDDLSFSD